MAVGGALRPAPGREQARIASTVRGVVRRGSGRAASVARGGGHIRVGRRVGVILAGGQMPPVEMLHQHEGAHALEHRHFHALAAAGALALEQRREHRMRGHLAAGLVRGDGGEVARRAGLPIHQVGHAGQALDDVVIGRLTGVGAIGAEAVQPHVDQPRVARGQGRRPQSQLLQFLRAHAVHEHVGGVDQRQQRFACGRLFQVEHHAALVAVGRQEDRGAAMVQCRPGPAGGVALRGFDLDHVGAVVRQDLRAVGPEDHRGEIDDADAGQGTAGGGVGARRHGGGRCGGVCGGGRRRHGRDHRRAVRGCPVDVPHPGRRWPRGLWRACRHSAIRRFRDSVGQYGPP